MSFVGKIFTVVVFVFSLVMMSLALMVGAAHKNWYDLVNTPQSEATAARPLGLKFQVEKERQNNKLLQDENDRLQRMIESEKNARQVEVARLETARLGEEQKAKGIEAQHQKEVEALAAANASLTKAETALAEKQKDIDGLRTEIRDAQDARDKTIAQIVDVADKNHQLALTVTNLQRRGVELAGQIKDLRNVLAAYNLDAHSDVTGIAPRLNGIVKEVRNNGQEINVVVSVGSDDGLREGHEMNVFRGENLIGRIRVVSVESNRAVGASNPKYYTRPFQAGDRAYTITPSAALDRQASNRK